MEDDEFIVLPGDGFRCQSTAGGIRIAQVIREMNDGTLSVYFWTLDPVQNYYLPTVLSGSSEEGVINRPPTLSSLVFLHHADDILSYSKRYTYGQMNVYCFRQLPDHLSFPTIQSISCITGEGIGRLSTELHRILCNKRQNQTSYSVSSVPTTHLVWRYLRDTLGLEVFEMTTTTTSQISRGKDMSITKVKKRIACVAMRVETVPALSVLISIFGVTAAVGIRKKIPGFEGRLGPNDNLIFERVGIHKLDNINLVDVISNCNRPQRPPNARFKLNADGYQGIDFFFFPELCSIRISVRYTCFVAQDAEEKLLQLGILEQSNRRRLTDEELDLI